MNIAGVEIGQGHPCRTICEVSNNHNGSLDRAKRIITAAKEAGADFIKFQCYLPDELVALRGDGPAPEPWGSDGFTMKSLYEKAQTPHEWFPELVAHANWEGIPWFSSVFGPDSFALLEGLGCPAYKLASLDFHDERLFGMACCGKLVIRSVSSHYAPDAVMGPVEYMYCPREYPQPRAHLGNILNGYLGYSYHGTDPETPALAAMCGAKLVEVHFHLEDEPSVLEANVSLHEQQFTDMVTHIRHVEALL